VRTFGGPVDLGHGDGAGEEVLGELAGYRARGGLFDFGQVEIEQAVEEGEEFVAGGEVGSVHHSYGYVCGAHGGVVIAIYLVVC